MIIRRKIYKNILFSLGAMMLASVFFVGSAHAAPATFTVTNTDDSGPGTLRQAIIDANSNGNPSDMDVVEFGIAGSGVYTIQPLTQLPDITEKVTIDGYTQAGSAVNTAVAPQPLNNVIKIELDFSSLSSGNKGVVVLADNTVISGLALFSDNTTDSYIRFEANDVGFIGNYGGLRADGMTRVIASHNNIVARFAPTYSGCKIGGTNPAERNVVAALPATTTTGVINVESDECTVKGNYIGLAKDGVTSFNEAIGELASPAEGSSGIQINGPDSVIGGSELGATNVISGSGTVQVAFGGNVTGGTLQGNFIGTDYTGNANSSIISGIGIAVTGAGNILIGGTEPGEGNIIAGVSGTGVALVEITVVPYGFTGVATKIPIIGNTINEVSVFRYDGFGDSNLGIDHMIEFIYDLDPLEVELENQGPTPNDVGDADTGPNGYINTPVLKAAQQVGNQLTVTYDLDATDSPSDSYRVEFFANDESTIFGAGPAQTYLGAATGVTPGTDIIATLTVNDDVTNKALSATNTAIDNTTSSGFGSTSELARNISIGSPQDYDSDGILDSAEDLGPNNGDGNNDGTPDRLQPTVTTFEIDSTGIYETLVTTGCSENGTVTSVDASSLVKADAGKSYPYGLVDFTLNCSRGDTVNVTKYVFVDDQPDSYTLRKYNPNTEVYTDVTGSTVSSQVVGNVQALVSTYAITDGGELDDDGEANGIIVDPVGLAATAAGGATGTGSTLASTGENLALFLLGAGTLMVGGVWLSRKAFKK